MVFRVLEAFGTRERYAKKWLCDERTEVLHPPLRSASKAVSVTVLPVPRASCATDARGLDSFGALRGNRPELAVVGEWHGKSPDSFRPFAIGDREPRAADEIAPRSGCTFSFADAARPSAPSHSGAAAMRPRRATGS